MKIQIKSKQKETSTMVRILRLITCLIRTAKDNQIRSVLKKK